MNWLAKEMIRTVKPNIIYFSPRYNRPFLTAKYADAIARAGSNVEILSPAQSSAEAVRGMVKTEVPFHVFPDHWYLPLVWRWDALVPFRFSLPSRALLGKLLRMPINMVISGHPEDLPMADFVARLRGARLGYIPFEYYPGLSGYDDVMLSHFKRLEEQYARKVSCWISAGDTLTEIYLRSYKLDGKVATIYNGAPRDVDIRPKGLRRRIGATADSVILFYSGQVSENRGVWDVLKALPHTPESVIFVVMGFNPGRLRSDALAMGLGSRVHVLDAVPQDELMGYTAEADIGIIPVQDICLSYRNCNPGKLFEYLAAGLPLIVNHLAQLSWYVTTRGLGEVMDVRDPQSIARAITKIAENPGYRQRCSDNARRTHLQEACWEIQGQRLGAAVLRGMTGDARVAWPAECGEFRELKGRRERAR
jgi:glycosyltransferase involved in cell wall biosynthesis